MKVKSIYILKVNTLILINTNFTDLIAITISFEQPTYIVNEADEKVEPVLVLSNPSSSIITVQVFSTDGSATGKQLTISCTIIE